MFRGVVELIPILESMGGRNILSSLSHCFLENDVAANIYLSLEWR